jgi:hypothetical protein
MLVSCLGSFLALKMVTVSSKMSGDFPWTTQRYIPENTTPHIHHGENLWTWFAISSVLQMNAGNFQNSKNVSIKLNTE